MYSFKPLINAETMKALTESMKPSQKLLEAVREATKPSLQIAEQMSRTLKVSAAFKSVYTPLPVLEIFKEIQIPGISKAMEEIRKRQIELQKVFLLKESDE